MSNWCKLCCSRYQHVFFGATGPRALKSCLRLWKFCFSLLFKLNKLDEDKNKFERKWCEKVKEIIKKSIYEYEFPRLVTLYKEKEAKDRNGPSFFYSRQTYNETLAAFKKMKLKKERKKEKARLKEKMKLFSQRLVTSNVSMYSETSSTVTSRERVSKMENGKHTLAPSLLSVNTMRTANSDGSDQTNVLTESPVDDATQLIMVIKGCRRYLKLDQEECTFRIFIQISCPQFIL